MWRHETRAERAARRRAERMSDTTKWVGILGTWSFPDRQRREWFQDGSTFAELMKAQGFEVATPGSEYVWSGDLDGTWVNRGNDWEAASKNLAFYLRHLPYEQRNLIAHSHGGTVTIPAALEVPIRSLVTIGTPARKETRRVGQQALDAGQIGAWAHVSDATWDWLGQLGALMDGDLRFSRTMGLLGCRDVRLKGIGHSSLLSGRMDLWLQHGLLSTLRDGR